MNKKRVFLFVVFAILTTGVHFAEKVVRRIDNVSRETLNFISAIQNRTGQIKTVREYFLQLKS